MPNGKLYAHDFKIKAVELVKERGQPRKLVARSWCRIDEAQLLDT